MDKNDAAVGSANKLARQPARDLIQKAEDLARRIGGAKDEEALETQLYKFLAAMRKAEMQAKKKPDSPERDAFIKDQLPLLEYKFAYAASRKKELKPFYEAVKSLMAGELVQDFEDFERLLDFVEAVIAYHKYHAKNKEQERT